MADLHGFEGYAVLMRAPSRVLKDEFIVPGGYSFGDQPGEMVGLATENIENGTYGAAFTRGIFSRRKRANSVAITAGQKVYSANSLSSINDRSGQGHTVFVGYATNSSPAGSSELVDVWMEQGGDKA